MSNRRDIQFHYSPHNKPTVLDCNFIVSSTDVGGYGLTNLNKSGRIASVYMHTAASFAGDTHTNTVVDGIASTAGLSVGQVLSGTGFTAGTVITAITSSTAITVSPATSATNSAVTISVVAAHNPNPASSYIVVNLQDNYNTYLSSYASIRTPNSGSNLTVNSGTPLTIGQVYVITALGTSTQANWVSMGMLSNLTAAVGVAFVARATSGTGNGTVQIVATGASGITGVELIGNPNVMNSTGPFLVGSGQGMQLIYRCVAPSFTGESYTPAGAISRGNIPVVAGTAGDAVTNNLGALNSTGGEDLTVDLQTFTGTAHTLAGTMSLVNAAPANGTLISFNIYLNNSEQGV